MLFLFLFVRPIEFTVSQEKVSNTTATSTKNSAVEEMNRAIDNLSRIGLNDVLPLIRYNAFIENRSGAFINTNQVASSTFFCNNNDQNQTLPYGIPQLISTDLDGEDTKNLLTKFTCDKIELFQSSPVFEIPPGGTLFVGTYLIFRAKPTYWSYPIAYLAFLAILVGILALVREVFDFVKNGKKYFWR